MLRCFPKSRWCYLISVPDMSANGYGQKNFLSPLNVYVSCSRYPVRIVPKTS